MYVLELGAEGVSTLLDDDEVVLEVLDALAELLQARAGARLQLVADSSVLVRQSLVLVGQFDVAPGVLVANLQFPARRQSAQLYKAGNVLTTIYCRQQPASQR